jgi:hypothetical protein
MSKHTPGPWTVWENGDDEIGVDDLYQNSVCTVEKGETRMADASLIAAAPELLAALELLLSARDDDGAICPSGVVVAQVKAAIAKAKGETQ